MPRRKQPEPFLSLGFQLIDWIESFLVHGPGDVEGEPIVLDDEFAAFILRAYALDKEGRRRIRRAVISRPKGRAKSELAAMIACAEAIGPVRFDHFAEAGEVSAWGYAFEAGEPVGAPVTRPEVLCFATELGQAGNTYDAVRYMLDPGTASPELVAHYGKVDVGLTRVLLPNGGSITPESAADSSKDGGKSTFVVADESHLWVLPRLKRLHQVVLRNLFKRKIASGWMLETTTMYAPGEGSVAEGTHDYAKKVAEGGTKDSSLLFDHRQAAAKWDPTKKRDRLSGLAEVYGPAAEWMDLEAIADSYDDPQTSPAEWERYWFNRPVSLQGGWLPQRAWDECFDPRPIPDGARVVLGLDGSFSGDSTALAVVELGEFPHLSVAGLWEKPAGDSEWRAPILDVEEAIRTAFLRWHVVEVTADPHRWARSLEVLAAEGLPVTEFPQSASRMTPATQRFTDMVNQRQLTHDGNPALARHISNAVLKSDARGTRIYKETSKSPRKIDLAVASIMALERSMHFQEAPPEVVPQFFSFDD
jgi:phage terminase large subunit-like protein